MPKTKTPEAERFWPRVRKGSGCWLWIGRRDTWGYGVFVNADGVGVGAHRFAYELVVGSVPEGKQLDHLCRIQACVRPDHLEPVTARENQIRSNSPTGVNARRTHCIRGHPFDDRNTIIQSDGHRNCRACVDAYQRQWTNDHREHLNALRRERRRKSKSDVDVARSGYQFSAEPIREPR